MYKRQEEPETYMHPQMQELFIKKITEAINELLKGKAKNINSQLLITTHSPHILNSKIHHGCSLNNINYIKCEHNIPKIINLNDENIVSENNSAADLAFIKKHIKFKISELFFAEAAIFVEGITEYHLLQYYIDNDDFLSNKTISIILIDGAHAKVYENLISSLGIPVVILTDLDIQRQKEEKGEGDNNNKTFIQVNSIETRDTTNNTLIYFYQGEKKLSKISDNGYFKKGNLMVCSQIDAINGFYATSFEEAFILTNYNNKILNDTLHEIKPEIYTECTNNGQININKSFELQRKLTNDKSRFANTLLFNMLSSADPTPKLPQYIEDAFSFVKEKLGGSI